MILRLSSVHLNYDCLTVTLVLHETELCCHFCRRTQTVMMMLLTILVLAVVVVVVVVVVEERQMKRTRMTFVKESEGEQI